MSGKQFIFVLTYLVAPIVGAQTNQEQPGLVKWSIRPTAREGGRLRIAPSELTGESVPLRLMIATAWGIPQTRVLGPGHLASDRYEVTAIGPTEDREEFRELLRKALEKHFRLAAHLDRQEKPVYVLQSSGNPKLNPGTSGPGSGTFKWDQEGWMAKDVRLASVANSIESVLGSPSSTRLGCERRMTSSSVGNVAMRSHFFKRCKQTLACA
jgi:uncharacterized protein (TIGR03435 family)